MTLRTRQLVISISLFLSIVVELIFWELFLSDLMYGVHYSVDENPIVALNVLNFLSSILIITSLIVYKRGIEKSVMTGGWKGELFYTLLLMLVLAELFISIATFVLLNFPADIRFG